MDHDWKCLLGKFQPSQIVSTPCRRYKIRCSRKTDCADNIQQVYRAMQNQRNVQYMELLDKKLAGPGPEISVHPGVTLFFFL